MIDKMILVEGKNDQAFIEWLLGKVDIILPRAVIITNSKGKLNIPKVLNSLVKKVNDSNPDRGLSGIDFSSDEVDIKDVLIIKDCDEGDNLLNEQTNYQVILGEIFGLELHYICGDDNPPQILETLFINNNGDLLRNFKVFIDTFNREQLMPLRKSNHKNIFEAYLKLDNGRIEYTKELFDRMFNDDRLVQVQHIQELIYKIKEFIRDVK